MRLWLSSEVQADVSDALSRASRQLENMINEKIGDAYASNVDELAVITILRPKIPDGWGEVYQFDAGDRTIESRLIIDYNRFKGASADDQINMLFCSILRAIDLISQLKDVDLDISRLRRDVLDAVGPIISDRNQHEAG